MISIRKATSEDTPEIVDMHIALKRHLEASNPHIWKTTTNREKLTETYQNPDLLLYITTTNNTTNGYICGQIQTRTNMTPHKIGFIRNIYVKPEHRHKGTATKLVKTLCNHYTQQNVDEVNLRYVIGNKEAENFWNKLGFRPNIVTANKSLKELNVTLQGSL